MVRGFGRVVQLRELVPGKFYLEQRYNGAPELFQWIELASPADGEATYQALYFSQGERPEVYFGDLMAEAFVALDDVQIRVRPESLNGSRMSITIQPGTFIVDERSPILAVGVGHRGWRRVDPSSGRLVTELGHYWLAFSKWSLVAGDECDERVLFEP